MKIRSILLATFVVLSSGLSTAQSAVYYWDRNNNNPGGLDPGTSTGDGDWNTATSNWNLNSDGSGANVVWADGNDAVFSAGTDVQGVGTPLFPFDAVVTLTAPQAMTTLTIEEGWVRFAGGTAALKIGTGATDSVNSVLVKQGATLEITNALILDMLKGGLAGHDDNNPPITTLDGGTLRNSIIGAGSQFWGPVTLSPTVIHSSRIELTSNGGTVNAPNGPASVGGVPDDINGTYSIVGYHSNAPHTSVIGMSPGTTAATLRKTGHGEFRASSNWTFTSLDVQAGLYRILNTINGGSDSGFGAVTGTVTVAGGAVANSTNGAALGTTANLTDDVGAAGSSPVTRSFVLSGVGDTPDTMIVLNANWQIKGPISGAGGLMLNGWARNDAAGTPNIIGTENELRLSGNNTYGGKTTLNFGTIVASGGSAIPNTSRVEISAQSDWGVAAAPAANHRTFNIAVLRVDASETVGSLAGGNATRGSVNINGAAVTLTTGADNTTSTFSGAITGTGGLTKTGTGTFTMDGVKSYTGDTHVTGGTLSTNSSSLADLADVYLSTGSIFNLNFAGNDTIDSLFFNGTAQAVGTWGAAGSGATNISAFFTGSGILQVSNLPSAGVPGDFNGNGTVDAADYVVWRNAGPADTLPNDPTPGVVDATDYTTWAANFGKPPGAGSGLGNSAAVPEPTSLVLLAMAFLGLAASFRKMR